MIVVIHIICIILTVLLIAANVRGWVGFVKADKRYRAEAGAEAEGDAGAIADKDTMADVNAESTNNAGADKAGRSKVLCLRIWTTVNLFLLAPSLIIYSMVPQVIPSTSTVLTVCKVMDIIAIASAVAGLIYASWNYIKWPKEDGSQGNDGQADGNAGRNNKQDL